MPFTSTNNSELEAAWIAQEQATARQSVVVMKALIDQRLGLHEVDFDGLAAKVTSIANLLDGDETTEGYQVFAALSTKLNTVEAASVANAAGLANLQAALANQIATLTGRVDQVESDSQAGRAVIDGKIDTLRAEYEAHVAAKLVSDTTQNTRLDDHVARVEALEAAKTLNEARIAALEGDNTTNKSNITQIQTTLAAQADALAAELVRAQNAEQAIRDELATERARTDGLVTASQNWMTYQEASDAKEAASMANVVAMWSEAGLTMPAGLAMPNGTTSA